MMSDGCLILISGFWDFEILVLGCRMTDDG